jgi:hypothetical protein
VYANTMMELNRPTSEQEALWVAAVPEFEKALDLMNDTGSAMITEESAEELRKHTGALVAYNERLLASNEQLQILPTSNQLPTNILSNMQIFHESGDIEGVQGCKRQMVEYLEFQPFGAAIREKLLPQIAPFAKGKGRAIEPAPATIPTASTQELSINPSIRPVRPLRLGGFSPPTIPTASTQELSNNPSIRPDRPLRLGGFSPPMTSTPLGPGATQNSSSGPLPSLDPPVQSANTTTAPFGQFHVGQGPSQPSAGPSPRLTDIGSPMITSQDSSTGPLPSLDPPVQSANTTTTPFGQFHVGQGPSQPSAGPSAHTLPNTTTTPFGQFHVGQRPSQPSAGPSAHPPPRLTDIGSPMRTSQDSSTGPSRNESSVFVSDDELATMFLNLGPETFELRDYRDGRTEFGLFVATRPSQTENARNSRFIINAGTADFPHYIAIKGNDLDPHGAETLVSLGQDVVFDSQRRRRGLKATPNYIKYGPCIEMPRAQDYAPRPGARTRRPDAYIRVEYADDHAVNWLTRSEYSQLTGKKCSERHFAEHMSRFERLQVYMNECKRRNWNPETRQPLTQRERQEYPWLCS